MKYISSLLLIIMHESICHQVYRKRKTFSSIQMSGFVCLYAFLFKLRLTHPTKSKTFSKNLFFIRRCSHENEERKALYDCLAIFILLDHSTREIFLTDYCETFFIVNCSFSISTQSNALLFIVDHFTSHFTSVSY